MDYSVHRLTSRGHELLGSVRDEGAWRFVKETSRKVGAVTLNAVFGIAEGYVKMKIIQALGIPTA